MSLNRRLLLVPLCLIPALLLQWALQWHLDRGSQAAYPELHQPLAKVPLTLEGPTPEYQKGGRAVPTTWQGIEHPHREALGQQIPFADEYLYRAYAPKAGGGPLVELYMVYSRTGEDRKHHPEVCVREAAGKPEDLSARRIVPLDEAGDRSVQRFRFKTGTGRFVVIYYWHYTFPSQAGADESLPQQVHRSVAHTPPSITVQVSTSASADDLEAVERSFLPLLDAELQKAILPPRTAMGCDRVPITLVRQ